ncbi:MAG: hypothetical protein ACPF9D_08730 [Owenweeksia sp.]
MKDVFKILEQSHKAQWQKMVPISAAEYPNSQWQALNLIETSAQIMLKRISSALPRGFSENIKEVKMDLLEKPGSGEKLFIKAQVYPAGKKQQTLKIFVHEIAPNGKAIKLAKAYYSVEIAPVINNRVA